MATLQEQLAAALSSIVDLDAVTKVAAKAQMVKNAEAVKLAQVRLESDRLQGELMFSSFINELDKIASAEAASGGDFSLTNYEERHPLEFVQYARS